jgi:hypothetical protein
MKLLEHTYITDHFSDKPLKIGDPVFIGNDFIGLSMHNIVAKDPCKEYLDWRVEEVYLNSKFLILVQGIVVMQFPKSWKMPRDQNLYADIDTKKISWRATYFKVGKTLSKQNSDGYCKVKVNAGK